MHDTYIFNQKFNSIRISVLRDKTKIKKISHYFTLSHYYVLAGMLVRCLNMFGNWRADKLKNSISPKI